MADGSYRFQQGAGPFHYPQHNQQPHHPRHLPPRAASPATSGRLAFNTDTPSPTRSPGTQSPAYNAFSMFNQGNQQQNQHVLNSGANHRFGLSMNNMTKHFPHQAHQNQAHQHQQHQDHTGAAHDLSRNNYGAHQHSISGGALGNPVSHFGATHLQNGTPGSGHSVLNEAASEHWNEQQRLCQESRNMSQSHVYARNHASLNKNVVSTTTNGFSKDSDKDYRGSLAPVENKGPKQAWTVLDFSGQNLKTIALPLFSYEFLTRLYLNNNKLHVVPPQIGKLRNLTFLDLSINQIKTLPPEIGMLVNLKQLLLFDNQIEELPFEMGSLYQLEMLGVEGNIQLGEQYKAMIVKSGTAELVKALRENAQCPPPLEDRPTINVDETPYPAQDRFSVLSYNTLCDKAASPILYGYTPSEALSWEHRKNVILDELRDRDADVICLQEIDSENYNEFFRPKLAHNDYKGIYWPRPRVRTMTEKEAKLVDGCAIFFKNSKYVLLDKQLVDISNVAINRPDMKGEHDIFNRVMPRDHIAIVAFLENRQTGTRLIVVNAHIFWDPAYTDVKIVQVAILLEQISKISEKYAKWPACTDKALYKYTNGDTDDQADPPEEVPEPAPSVEYSDKLAIPLLLCGDFNSTPDSSVCELIGNGALANNHVDLGNRKYGDFTKHGMSHPFSFRSSYTLNDLPFTNYTPPFVGMLDYIWYSANALQVTKLLGPIDESYLQRVPGFPNYHFPSDHIALKVDFTVKGRKKTTEADFGSQSRDRRPNAA